MNNYGDLRNQTEPSLIKSSHWDWHVSKNHSLPPLRDCAEFALERLTNSTELKNECIALKKTWRGVERGYAADYKIYPDHPYTKFAGQAHWNLGVNSSGHVQAPENSWILIKLQPRSNVQGYLKFHDYRTEEHLLTINEAEYSYDSNHFVLGGGTYQYYSSTRWSDGNEMSDHWLGGRSFLLKSDSVIVNIRYAGSNYAAAPWAFSWEFVDKDDYDEKYNKCHQLLNYDSENMTVSSPGFPFSMPKGLRCEYIIGDKNLDPEQTAIEINFNEPFDMFAAYLEVLDGEGNYLDPVTQACDEPLSNNFQEHSYDMYYHSNDRDMNCNCRRWSCDNIANEQFIVNQFSGNLTRNHPRIYKTNQIKLVLTTPGYKSLYFDDIEYPITNTEGPSYEDMYHKNKLWKGMRENNKYKYDAQYGNAYDSYHSYNRYESWAKSGFSLNFKYINRTVAENLNECGQQTNLETPSTISTPGWPDTPYDIASSCTVRFKKTVPSIFWPFSRHFCLFLNAPS